MVKVVFKLWEDDTTIAERYEQQVPRKGEYVEYNYKTYEVKELKWSYLVATTATVYLEDIDGDDEVNL